MRTVRGFEALPLNTWHSPASVITGLKSSTPHGSPFHVHLLHKCSKKWSDRCLMLVFIVNDVSLCILRVETNSKVQQVNVTGSIRNKICILFTYVSVVEGCGECRYREFLFRRTLSQMRNNANILNPSYDIKSTHCKQISVTHSKSISSIWCPCVYINCLKLVNDLAMTEMLSLYRFISCSTLSVSLSFISLPMR